MVRGWTYEPLLLVTEAPPVRPFAADVVLLAALAVVLGAGGLVGNRRSASLKRDDNVSVTSGNSCDNCPNVKSTFYYTHLISKVASSSGRKQLSNPHLHHIAHHLGSHGLLL